MILTGYRDSDACNHTGFNPSELCLDKRIQ